MLGTHVLPTEGPPMSTSADSDHQPGALRVARINEKIQSLRQELCKELPYTLNTETSNPRSHVIPGMTF
uniref:Uncharacterized protein n=1 Tax=Rousettus aegyptiacus TaxID=9407 RepID=A0A7J8C2U6_ROUAE|nr:hypothetical protein HJG63_009485 [Rousettus aegyptiacus]